jgi:hypothetical protein
MQQDGFRIRAMSADDMAPRPVLSRIDLRAFT